MEKHIETLKRVKGELYDGTPLTPDQVLNIKIGAPMWFSDSLIKEINDKEEIEVIVIKNYDGKDHIHLTNASEDLIIRVQKAFWGYPKH